MSTDEQKYVTQVTPVDLAGIRDNGMKALVLLAASLGWNVRKRHNTPIIITARNGFQKQLPTNTSIRMSVFQTTLVSILLYTEDDIVPTVELIDEIVKMAKPSRDHQHRLYSLFDDTKAAHRQRVESAAAEHKREPDEHLTQHPIIEEAMASIALDGETQSVPPAGPADGEEHGELVSRGPFMAHYSGSVRVTGAYTYQSQASLERIWEDGYKDYECVVCGKAFTTPRGVGGHRQQHIKAGEAESLGNHPYTAPGAVLGTDPEWSATKRNQQAVEFVDELPEETHLEEQEEQLLEVVTREYEGSVFETLDQIVDLVLPRVKEASDRIIAALTRERDEALKRVAEVEGEFEALVDLLNSRRKT